MGKIIVIEGSDGCGKQTQAELLTKHFINDGQNVRMYSFPTYGSPQAAPVEHFLKGEFGTRDDFSAIQISSLYAVDRFLTCKKDRWYDFLKDDGILIFDRYVESNVIYQCSHLMNYPKMESALQDQLKNMEYVIYELPKPDIHIYLHVPYEISNKLIDERNKKDINENDLNLLKRVHEYGLNYAKKNNWIVIECVENGIMRSREDIHNEIWEKIYEN